MNPSAPRVSVVIPVFNGAQYVSAALKSVAAQTMTDFDAIVVDDGSTDASLREIRRSVGEDSRFRIISRENRGLVATCNEAVQLSKSRYVFRMDADDIAHPRRFESQLQFLDAHPTCVALGTRVLLADDELMPIIEMFQRGSHDEIDADNLRGIGSAICHPSVAMRRDALVAVGGYRAEFEWAEDLDLFLRLAEVGRLANLPEVLLTYRQHLSSVGYSKRRVQMERAALAASAARRRRDGNSPTPPPEVDPNCVAASVETTSYGSIAEIHRKWAWLALLGGHPRTARKHAVRAIRLEPWSTGNLRLAACVIRGH